MKLLILGVIFVILYCLFSAGYFMLSRNRSPEAMAKALTWRIALSVILFAFLILGFYLGWIKPHGI